MGSDAIISGNVKKRGYEKEMGKKARKFIVENYGWGEVAQKTEKLYEAVISQRKNIT